MGKFKKIIKYIVDSDFRFSVNTRYGKYNYLSDVDFLKRKYKALMKKELNLDNPQMFNEKLQWLKLHDHNPEYTRIVDKITFKEFITEKIGSEYTVPTLGVWDNFDDIDFSKLPDKFVLKCNHDSGGLVICKDKSKLNKKKARRKINNSLKRNFYMQGREWPYNDVKPRILAEEFLEMPDGITEYKLFSFNGRTEIVLVCKGVAHTEGRTNTFFDRDFNRIPVENVLKNQTEPEEKPAEYDKLLEIADKLSEGIPQVRVDFYIINGRIYLGEMTFYHNSGFAPFTPEEWDYKFGEYIDLEMIKK